MALMPGLSDGTGAGLRKLLDAATPGPWEVDADESSLDVRGREHKTATIWIHLAGPWTMGEDADDGVQARAMADAQLVALAPELAAWGLDVFERHAHLLDDDLLNRWQEITGGE